MMTCCTAKLQDVEHHMTGRYDIFEAQTKEILCKPLACSSFHVELSFCVAAIFGQRFWPDNNQGIVQHFRYSVLLEDVPQHCTLKLSCLRCASQLAGRRCFLCSSRKLPLDIPAATLLVPRVTQREMYRLDRACL